jgi:hypothetical protein
MSPIYQTHIAGRKKKMKNWRWKISIMATARGIHTKREACKIKLKSLLAAGLTGGEKLAEIKYERRCLMST